MATISYRQRTKSATETTHHLMYKEISRMIPAIIFSFGCVLGLQLIGLVPPLVMRNIVDVYIPVSNLSKTYLSIAILTGIPIVSTLVNIFFTSKNAILARKQGFDLKRRVFLNVLRQPMCFFDESKSGELSSYCGKEISDFVAFWLLDIPRLVADILMMFVILVILFRISISITSYQLLSIPILLIPTRFLSKKMKTYTQQIWAKNSEANHITNESFVGIRFVKASCLEQYRIKKLQRIHDEVGTIWGKAVAWERLTGDWSQMLVSAAFAGLGFAMCAIQVIQGNITLGALIAYISYLPKVHGVISHLASTNIKIQKQMGEHEKTFEFLSQPEEDTLVPRDKEKFDLTGNITFSNVNFQYPTSEKLILQGMDFHVEEGEFVGIVGASGVGKSTIFDLLLKFYKPLQGVIKIGGKDIWEVPTNIIRENISLVSQETFLFAGTLKENLKVANPGANDARLLEALKIANLIDFVANLPNGLETEIGENGVKLSGGEKQRLSLARAILRNSKILLLDEVTASLDAVSERAIRSAINDVIAAQQVTVLAIAHRVSFLQDSSKILVINNGRVEEIGIYEELAEVTLL